MITPVCPLWSKPHPLRDVTEYNNRRLAILCELGRDEKRAGPPQWMDRVGAGWGEIAQHHRVRGDAGRSVM